MGWRIHAPSGAFFQARFGAGDHASGTPEALAIPRERLDGILVAAAERAGALFRGGAHVTDILRHEGAVTGVTGRGQDGRPFEVRARLVVGADGLRSVVARRLGLVRREPRLRKISLTAHMRGVVGASTGIGEMHLAPGACLGLAPVEDAPDPLWNVTLVVDGRLYGDAVAADPVALFRSALEWFPMLRGRLRGARLVPDGRGRLLLTSGPFDWSMRQVIEPGAALVGDAGGYYDPFTGQGIFQALASAELLAGEAERALRQGQHAPLLRGYARRRRRLLGGARRLQRLIEAVLARPALAEIVIERLRRAPTVADALIGVTGDLAPARSLLDPRLLLGFVTGTEEEVHP